MDKLRITEDKLRYVLADCDGVAESMPLDLSGHTPYGVSKLAGDLYVQDYAYTYGLRTAVFRMSCVYGTHQFGFEDQGWISHLLISALAKRPITIYGNGKQVRDVLYISDLIRAFDSFVHGSIQHGVYNIGGGNRQTLSLLELILRLENMTKSKIAVHFADWRPSDQRVYISDISHVSEQLGWHPLITPEDGLRRLLVWAEANKSLFV